MKAFAALLFVALATAAYAGPDVIANHPVCKEINNDYYHSFADPDDCTCFYKCDWANAVRFCCPADNESDGNLVFNPDLQVCDRRNAAIAAGAECAATSDPTVTSPTNPPTCHPPTDPATEPTPVPTEPTEIPEPTDGCAHRVAECPVDNAFYHSYGHATCDNKWCQCDWGKAIEQPCARDHAPRNYLIFNEVLQVCDYQKDGVAYNLCDY